MLTSKLKQVSSNFQTKLRQLTRLLKICLQVKINMSTTKEYWGNKEWYCHGKLHRDNDLPAFISARGDKEWYQHGKRHPDNGPAVVRKDGVCSWYRHGLHLETC